MNDRQKKKYDSFIKHCKEIAQCKLSWGASGNMSMRTGKDECIITATGSHYARMSTKNIARCRISDARVLGLTQPSCEYCMHTSIYKMRPDISYIVHVHPLFSVLMISAEKVKINLHIVPEAEHYLGKVVTVPYYAAGSKELAQAVEKKIKGARLVILKKHGIIALGDKFEQALAAIEAFEFIAQLNYYAHAAHLKLKQFPH